MINKAMVPMGALQPGLPAPAAIPSNLFKIVIDLKNCFFSIPLHPDDCLHFAFSLPQINFQGPMDRYQWRVLPQGMAYSPTLAQKHVALTLKPVRNKWPEIYILHYADDILIAAPTEATAFSCFEQMLHVLQSNGLLLAPEKVQVKDPYNFLGYQLNQERVYTPKISLDLSTLKTLYDFQSLLGNLPFLRPYLKIAPETLVPLQDLLTGNPHPFSSHTLTLAARESIKTISDAISSQAIFQYDPLLPLSFIVCETAHAPLGVFWQKGMNKSPSGHPLMWVPLRSKPAKILATYFSLVAALILKARKLAIQYFGKDPDIIIVPYTSEQVDW